MYWSVFLMAQYLKSYKHIYHISKSKSFSHWWWAVGLSFMQTIRYEKKMCNGCQRDKSPQEINDTDIKSVLFAQVTNILISGNLLTGYESTTT